MKLIKNIMLIMVVLLFASCYSKTSTQNKKEVVSLDEYEVYDKEVAVDNYYKWTKVYSAKHKIVGEPIFTTYLVKDGDTMSGIAARHGSQSLQVLYYNNPKLSKNIRAGNEVRVAPTNGIEYTVVNGDTLESVQKKFSVGEEAIIKYSKDPNKTLKIGEKLYIDNPKLTAKNTSNYQYSSSEFVTPVKWTGITSKFGMRFHPVLKRNIGHNGVDMKASNNTTLYASRSGRVTYAGWMSGYGKIVIIDHGDGFETRYAHLNRIGVSKGQRVDTKEVIGKTGSTGRVTGPHLHFEIRKNGAPKNPLNYIKKG